jgi:histidine ammonia-lyase
VAHPDTSGPHPTAADIAQQTPRGAPFDENAPLILGDQPLTPAHLVAVARHGRRVLVGALARERAAAAHRAVAEIRTRRHLYGRDTGVGGNHGTLVDPARTTEAAAAEAPGPGLRLLRSHAGGAGPTLDAATGRALLLVRLNQLARGGAGVDPSLLGALAEALNAGLAPRVPRYGSVGTGDLTALAATGLALRGERPWLDGRHTRYRLDDTDTLALLSSSAATLATAGLFAADVAPPVEACLTVAALSFLALGGSAEPYQRPVIAAREHPGARRAAARLREILGSDARRPAARVQDPFGLRVLPQVHGLLLDALAELLRVLAVDLNAAAENPLISADAGGADTDERDPAAFHNGNFHAGYLTHALDAVRTALHEDAALSAARLVSLHDPGLTGLPAFLAEGPAGSSGSMILEYTAHDALAEIRTRATPASLGGLSLSRGVENHASFAPVAARAATALVEPYRTVLACELVAATRALRAKGIVPSAEGQHAAYERVAAALDPDPADRPLDEDIAAADALLDDLAR